MFTRRPFGFRERDRYIRHDPRRGRDVQTGKHHGGHSERERITWIATNSDRLNSHFKNMPPIVDILPSIATHLQLEMPEHIEAQLDGQPFID